MKRLYHALVVLMLAACVCPEIRDGDFSALNSTLPALNRELRGMLVVDEGMTDFGSYTIDQYRAHIERFFTEESGVLRDVLACSDQKSLTGRGDTFILCLRSVENGFVFCDDASTPAMDRFYHGGVIPEVSEVYQMINSPSQ